MVRQAVGRGIGIVEFDPVRVIIVVIEQEPLTSSGEFADERSRREVEDSQA